MQRVRDFAAGNPDSIVLISAHADTTDTPTRNLQLARLRSTAVRNRLVHEGGIAESRVFTIDLCGDRRPNRAVDHAADWA